MYVLVTQFPTIPLPPFFPLLSVCVLQSLFPLVRLSKHVVLSLVTSFSWKRQGQRVLYKYFKLNSTMLSECSFSNPFVMQLLFLDATTRCTDFIVFFICFNLHTHTRPRRTLKHFISVHVNCSFLHICLHKMRELHGWNQIISAFFFLLLLPLILKRGNCNYPDSGVNTKPAPQLASLLSPPLPPSSLSSLLLPWPISAEQWSVKKFPISKFTHCINLV